MPCDCEFPHIPLASHSPHDFSASSVFLQLKFQFALTWIFCWLGRDSTSTWQCVVLFRNIVLPTHCLACDVNSTREIYVLLHQRKGGLEVNSRTYYYFIHTRIHIYIYKILFFYDSFILLFDIFLLDNILYYVNNLTNII
jgi:hypothetical protein